MIDLVACLWRGFGSCCAPCRCARVVWWGSIPSLGWLYLCCMCFQFSFPFINRVCLSFQAILINRSILFFLEYIRLLSASRKNSLLFLEVSFPSLYLVAWILSSSSDHDLDTLIKEGSGTSVCARVLVCVCIEIWRLLFIRGVANWTQPLVQGFKVCSHQNRVVYKLNLPSIFSDFFSFLLCSSTSLASSSLHQYVSSTQMLMF